MRLIDKIKSFIFGRIDIKETNLLGIDIENVHNADSAIKLCELLSKKYNEKEKMASEYEAIINIYSTIQQIDQLSPEYKEKFEYLAHNYIETINEKEEYKEKIKPKSNELTYLEQYMEDMENIINSIKEIEDKQQLVKNDIHQLEGEKGALTYQKNRLNRATQVVKWVMILLLCLFSFSAIIITILYTFYDKDTFLYAIILSGTTGFFGLWIYIFRRYVHHELKKNAVLQKRAVELLNKIKIKFVNNERFLSYQYRKYKVNNSEMLQYKWDAYQQNIRDKSNYRVVTKHIITIEDEIETLINKTNIEESSIIFENIEKLQTQLERNKYMNDIDQQKKMIKIKLETCNNEIKSISSIIVDIKEKDETTDQVLVKLIDDYLNRANICIKY